MTMPKKKRVFVIAEAGSNWRVGTPEKDLAQAFALIDVASDAGADAVKFQLYKAETVYVQNAGQSEYLNKLGIKKSINEIFENFSMPYEMIPKLFDYCKNKSIEFMSSPFSVEDAKIVDPYVVRHKIASYEITHLRLIEYIAHTKKPLILSTGCATYDDIQWAVDWFKKCGGSDLALMQCTAKYPAPLSSLNLNVIPTLRTRFNLDIGFSDHSCDPCVGPIAAVTLGVSIIEKHFTLDRKLEGPDHMFALTPDELKEMVNAIRNAEECLGDSQKKVLDDEQELRFYAQRAVQAIRNIKKGEILLEKVNIDVLRPGQQKKGVHPRLLPQIQGRKALRDIQLGSGIEKGDYE